MPTKLKKISSVFPHNIEYFPQLPLEYNVIETFEGQILELPFARGIPIYISLLEAEILKGKRIESPEDQKAFLAINNTIYLVAREYLNEDTTQIVVPNFDLLPPHIFFENDKYLTAKDEVLAVREIKYARIRDVREEGLEVITRAFMYSYYAIFRSLNAIDSFRGLLHFEDVIDELKSESFDVIHNNFRLHEGTRVSTFLTRAIKQRLIREYNRIARAAYIPEKILKQLSLGTLPEIAQQNVLMLISDLSIDYVAQESRDPQIEIPDPQTKDIPIMFEYLVMRREIEILIEEYATGHPLRNPKHIREIGRAYFLDPPLTLTPQIGNRLAKSLNLSRERVRQYKELIREHLKKNRARIIPQLLGQ